MTGARSIMPTDVLALVAFGGRNERNEAWTRERIGADESQNTFGLLADQMLAFTRGRSAWIDVRRQRLQGLASARRRGGRQAWEIDYLIDCTPRHDVMAGLLECAIADVGQAGAEKLFLRLEMDSDLLPVARDTGFQPYQEEVLYTRGSIPLAASAPSLRPVIAADSYPLYRLYNLATPESTRRNEAATFNEWHASQERHWTKGGVNLIQERDGSIVACAQAARIGHGIAVDLLMDASAVDGTTAILTAACRAASSGDCPVFVLLPGTSESIARRLEDSGFTPSNRFVSLMRRTTRTLPLPKLSPAVAKKAIGVEAT